MKRWLRVGIQCVLALLAMLGNLPGHAGEVDFQPLPTLDLLTKHHRIELWQSLRTLPDAANELQPAQAWHRISQGQGQALQYADQSYGNWIPYPYWAALRVHNPHPQAQSWVFSYELPTQDHAALWQSSPQGNWQAVPEISATRPPELWAGQLWPAWSLTLQPGETRTLLLRIDGYNRMRFPWVAVSPLEYAAQQTRLALGIGFVYAVPLVVLIYVLSLWREATDRAIPLFGILVFCEMVGAGWISGLFTLAFNQLDRATAGWLGWAGYVVMLGLSGWHAQIFMDTARSSPATHRLLWGVILFWLVIVPLGIAWYPNASRLTLLLGGVAHAVLLFALALRAALRLGYPYLWVFVFMWLVYLGSGVLYILYRVLHLPIHYTLVGNYLQGLMVAALLGWAVSLQILRRRRVLEQQVAQAHDRALLYAAAQHDLLQPLQSARLYVQDMRSTSTPPEQKEIKLKSIERALNGMNDFVHSLHFLRDGSTVTKPAIRYPLREVLAPVVDDMRALAEFKRIHLRCRWSAIEVCCDALSLQRIARNLLSNAIRYTDYGGSILLADRRIHGQRWLLCWDTGMGIAPEMVQQCFEAFTRHDPGQRIPEGLGLGLYSVRQLAASLGQQTHLRSVPGRGTCIGVSLPTST